MLKRQHHVRHEVAQFNERQEGIAANDERAVLRADLRKAGTASVGLFDPEGEFCAVHAALEQSANDSGKMEAANAVEKAGRLRQR